MSFSLLPSQLNLDNYHCVDLYERGGSSSGNLGLLILVRLHRELTDAEYRLISQARDAIISAIDREDAKLDTATIEMARIQRAEFALLFAKHGLVYIEPIPNGYCNQACCSQIPWYIITTIRGRIKLGWRKRVIQIDWSDSAIKSPAKDLFPEEDVIMDGKMIHAWGYEKARLYIDKLMSSQ